MANISDYISGGSGGAGAGGGGGIPEIARFTASEVWTVPQSIQDEVASEGHAEIGVFMVGGGTTAGSGEIVNEVRQVTTADYNIPLTNPPEITITVGAVDQDTGFTSHPTPDFTETFPTTVSAGGYINAGGNNFGIVVDDGGANINADGNILVNSITFPAVVQGSSDTVGNPITAFEDNLAVGTAFVNAPTFDQTTRTATWAAPEPFSGSLTASYIRGGGARVTITLTWDAANNRFNLFQSGGRGGNFWQTSAWEGLLEGGFALQNVARNGNHADFAEFLNERTDTRGYFGGWARFNGERPNSGSGGASPQGGYVQIFY